MTLGLADTVCPKFRVGREDSTDRTPLGTEPRVCSPRVPLHGAPASKGQGHVSHLRPEEPPPQVPVQRQCGGSTLGAVAWTPSRISGLVELVFYN